MYGNNKEETGIWSEAECGKKGRKGVFSKCVNVYCPFPSNTQISNSIFIFIENKFIYIK